MSRERAWFMKWAARLSIPLALSCASLAAAPPPAEPPTVEPPPAVDSFVPSSRQGHFDARKIGDRLEITLRVHFSFLEGDPNLVPGYAEAEYSWSDVERQSFKDEFQRRVESAWSGRHAFEATDGSETVAVEVRVREVAGVDDAHWLITVSHYPEDAPDTEASVCGPAENHFAGSCESNQESLTWGTVRLASTHLFLEHVSDLEIAPLDLWYSSDDHTPPADLLDRPPAWLVTDWGWSAHLTGYAAVDEVSVGATPGEVRPSIELARRRTRRVRRALIEQACREARGAAAKTECQQKTRQRIRVVNQGAYGEAPYDDRRLVQMEVFEPIPIDTLTHEAGHMLGLGDEASDEIGEPGTTLASPDYAALVRWYNNETVLRHDDDGIMSRGTVVRPRHYVTFLEALETLTGSAEWSIVEP